MHNAFGRLLVLMLALLFVASGVWGLESQFYAGCGGEKVSLWDSYEADAGVGIYETSVAGFGKEVSMGTSREVTGSGSSDLEQVYAGIGSGEDYRATNHLITEDAEAISSNTDAVLVPFGMAADQTDSIDGKGMLLMEGIQGEQRIMQKTELGKGHLNSGQYLGIYKGVATSKTIRGRGDLDESWEIDNYAGDKAKVTATGEDLRFYKYKYNLKATRRYAQASENLKAETNTDGTVDCTGTAESRNGYKADVEAHLVDGFIKYQNNVKATEWYAQSYQKLKGSGKSVDAVAYTTADQSPFGVIEEASVAYGNLNVGQEVKQTAWSAIGSQDVTGCGLFVEAESRTTTDQSPFGVLEKATVDYGNLNADQEVKQTAWSARGSQMVRGMGASVDKINWALTEGVDYSYSIDDELAFLLGIPAQGSYSGSLGTSTNAHVENGYLRAKDETKATAIKAEASEKVKACGDKNQVDALSVNNELALTDPDDFIIIDYGSGQFRAVSEDKLKADITSKATLNDVVIDSDTSLEKTALMLQPYAYQASVLRGATDLGQTVFPTLANSGYAVTRYTDSAATVDKYQTLENYNIALPIGHMGPNVIQLSAYPFEGPFHISGSDLDSWYTNPPDDSMTILAGCASFEGYPNPSPLANAVDEAEIRGGYSRSVYTIWSMDCLSIFFEKMSEGMTAEQANDYVWDEYRPSWAAEHGLDPNDVGIVKLVFFGNEDFTL